jgi:CBS domain-containing protein
MSEEDILQAMRDMHGYVDMTPGDFREIYGYAYAHALARLARGVAAREIMTAPVLCLGLDMGAAEAARLLAGRGVTGAPVVDAGGRVCGVVSEKDYLRRMGVTGEPSLLGVAARCLGTAGCLVADLRGLTVAGLMTAPAVVAPPEIAAADISALFQEKSINRLPIVDPDGRPLGIVTRTDLVRAFPGGR